MLSLLVLACAEKKEVVEEKPQEYVRLAKIERIESQILGETRVLNIYFPPGYADSTLQYPVIYALDGSENEDLIHILGLVQFMNMYQLLPQSIVVGIANVDRYRDFTHPSTNAEDNESLPQGGGSEKFLDFIESELQPWVEEKLKSNGKSTIIGQSMGGLLASEALLTRPHLFDDYLIVSPSLWWGDYVLVKGADSCIKTHDYNGKRVFVSLGEEHPVMHQVADSLVYALQKNEVETYYEPILTEDHATILHRAVYKGFETLYPKDKD